MSFNLDGLACHLDGSPVMLRAKTGGEENEHAAWKRLVVDAINGPYKGDDALSLSEKSLLGRLARLVQKGGDLTLKAENIARIKERVGKGWTPDLVLQICELLDPAEAKDGEL